ncbi:hypothetical protein [Hansschlegelia zhihuaiae]|uniref:Uncharacterized protein n=1 Tax=Hansschlegelia zhihuaiae TaxID=405005 RepID=A0A4V1KHK9_9HYPH|nr:hypothetical protein [Hansschlegelia zhihuaiae]RXF67552.1 hypothetical protein EK403_21205 [Hansschlegelia zhihuaiae]
MSRLASMLRTRGVWPAVEAELIRLGVAYRLMRGGKHPVVTIKVGERRRRFPIAGSPHAHGHSARKAVCQVRRIVTEMQEAAHG